jgi:hypothetical protein
MLARYARRPKPDRLRKRRGDALCARRFLGIAARNVSVATRTDIRLEAYDRLSFRSKSTSLAK